MNEEFNVCKCDENTTFEKLCPTCLNECLEYMAMQSSDYEEHA